MASFSANLDIPEIWYDFYVRLLPGTTFVSVLWFVILGNKFKPDVINLMIIVFAGYVLGFCVNPISSYITNKFEKNVKSDICRNLEKK